MSQASTKGIVLISGYSGFVAKHLSNFLSTQGFEVRGLSHSKDKKGKNVFYWNVEKNEIDEQAFKNADYLIHLAGAGIADKRWDDKRKKEIIDSRVKSAELLAAKLRKNNHTLKALVGASAVGYYGAQNASHIYKEEDKPYNDFLAEVCIAWEKSYENFNGVIERKTILRFGNVLGKDGGLLRRIVPIIKSGFGSPLGNGMQAMPFIHICDLCRLIEFSLSENISGTFNAVAPEKVNNKEFMKALAESLHKPFYMPAVPAFLLHLVYGEMADILLKAPFVSNEKINAAGFEFEYSGLRLALDNL